MHCVCPSPEEAACLRVAIATAVCVAPTMSCTCSQVQQHQTSGRLEWIIIILIDAELALGVEALFLHMCPCLHWRNSWDKSPHVVCRAEFVLNFVDMSGLYAHGGSLVSDIGSLFGCPP